MNNSSMRCVISKDRKGVSPVIGVILMVAITVVLAGVVFVWASSFTNQAEGEPSYFHVDPQITTTGGIHPDQRLTVEVMEGKIEWNLFSVKIDNVELNTSSEIDNAGNIEVFDIPNFDFPSGGILLTVGSQYTLKIISIDHNKIVFNDVLICENPQ
jgi:flagellin-like protein